MPHFFYTSRHCLASLFSRFWAFSEGVNFRCIYTSFLCFPTFHVHSTTPHTHIISNFYLISNFTFLDVKKISFVTKYDWLILLFSVYVFQSVCYLRKSFISSKISFFNHILLFELFCSFNTRRDGITFMLLICFYIINLMFIWMFISNNSLI